MYRYVSSPQASKYIVPPPQHRELSSVDVPESELEMREILNNWFADGLAPIIESEDDYISASDHVRFEKLSGTVGMLLRNKDYYFAALSGFYLCGNKIALKPLTSIISFYAVSESLL